MKLCRVLGPVVATIKHSAYRGLSLLIVQPVDAQRQASGASFLAVDRVQSGPGDLVLVMQEGNGVRQLFGGDCERVTANRRRGGSRFFPPIDPEQFPIRSVIVAHVDAVETAAP